MLDWLAWLADAMRTSGQSVLYVDWMQPEWLASGWQRRLVVVGVPLVIGIISGVAVGTDYAFASQVVRPPGTSAAVRAIVGVTSGLITLVPCVWMTRGSTITPASRLRWSWQALRHGFPGRLATIVIIAVSYGLVLGLVAVPISGWLVSGRVPSPFDVLILGPVTGLMLGLLFGIVVGSTYGLMSGLEIEFDPRPAAPGRGMHTSRKNALLAGTTGGLLFGGIVWLLFGLGYGLTKPITDSLVGALGSPPIYWPHAAIEDVLTSMLVSGLIIGSQFGGGAYLRHQILRLLLASSGCTPRDYVRFLEHATGLILLSRRGGGYEFVHRTLLDHFADLLAGHRSDQTGGRL